MADAPKYAPGKHPNTQAAIKANAIKPGQVLNPLGITGTSPDKPLRRLTKELLSELIEAAMLGDLPELERIAAAPGTPAIQVGACRALHKGISEGNWVVVEQVLARVLGKVPDRIDQTTNGQSMNTNLNVMFVKPGEQRDVGPSDASDS